MRLCHCAATTFFHKEGDGQKLLLVASVTDSLNLGTSMQKNLKLNVTSAARSDRIKVGVTDVRRRRHESVDGDDRVDGRPKAPADFERAEVHQDGPVVVQPSQQGLPPDRQGLSFTTAVLT